jgi:hypothetical protein
MPNFGKYNKTIAALIIGLLGWASIVVASEPSQVTALEWVGLGTTLATATGVYQFKNETDTKTEVAEDLITEFQTSGK